MTFCEKRSDTKDELTLSLIHIINDDCDQHHLLAAVCQQTMIFAFSHIINQKSGSWINLIIIYHTQTLNRT